MNIILIISFFFISIIGTFFAQKLCISIKMTDSEEKTWSVHKGEVARGGGIAIILPFFIYLVTIKWQITELITIEFINHLIIGLFMLALIGWFDDKYCIHAKWRFLFHIIIVAFCLYHYPQHWEMLPLWLEKLAFIIAWTWLINLFNFMDGMDGLITTQTIVILSFLNFFVPNLSIVILPLIALCCGFLLFNWYPAKIFLGDIGSSTLGYIVGGLFFIAVHSSTSDWVVMTLPMMLLSDATFTLIKRFCRNHTIWLPHNEHIFHKAYHSGLSHRQITFILLIGSVVNGIVAIITSYYAIAYIGFMVSLILPTVWGYYILYYRKKMNDTVKKSL